MGSWLDDLDAFTKQHHRELAERAARHAESRDRVAPFLREVVRPAFDAVREGFQSRGHHVYVDEERDPQRPSLTLVFGHAARPLLTYQISVLADEAVFAPVACIVGAGNPSDAIDISAQVLGVDDPIEAIGQLVLEAWKRVIVATDAQRF